MKKSLLVFAFLMPVVCASFVLSGCASLKEKYAQKPKVELENVTTRDATLKGATVVFGLKLQNPNEIDLPLDDLTYQVFLGGKFFAEGRTDKKIRVPAKGESPVEIPLFVEYGKVIEGIGRLIQGQPMDYTLKGNARFAAFTIPFEKTGDFKFTKD